MTDITKIAQACAARIFDRMELCRGSAMLKSDIEREVEMALRECAGPHADLETVVVSLPKGLYPPPPEAETVEHALGWIHTQEDGLHYHPETGAVFLEDDGGDCKQEEIAGVGYINDDKEHVLISIRNPTITSEVPKPTCAQIALTLENARQLAMELGSFIWQHDVDSEEEAAAENAKRIANVCA